ncbi:MAG: hypothetical protein ACI9KE_002551 [Polyangiales bacterium]
MQNVRKAQFAAFVMVCLAGCAEDGPGLIDGRCVPGGEAPQTIDDAVARLNSLPEVSLGCFVASLPRPLRMTATDSQFSAQPAAGVDRPRVFLHTDGLVLSLALGGEGQNLLEFGEWVDETRTVKGELAFPVEFPVETSAPFVRIARTSGREGTTCGLCHSSEDPVTARPGAFSSVAIAPARRDQVNVEYLRAVSERCDALADPHGCTLLHSLFDYGEVVYEDFDESVRRL